VFALFSRHSSREDFLSNCSALLVSFRPGLPDLYWYNIPKRWKIYQMTTNYVYVSYGHKIYKIDVK
jgi:hypothetical protein